jgi:hypothetical protein
VWSLRAVEADPLRFFAANSRAQVDRLDTQGKHMQMSSYVDVAEQASGFSPVDVLSFPSTRRHARGAACTLSLTASNWAESAQRSTGLYEAKERSPS